MRPAGDVRQALLGAALELVPPDVLCNPLAQRPTLREIAHKACVGVDAATMTMKNLCRAGQMRAIPSARKVDYRNKPVAEYEPAVPALDQDARHGQGWVDLGRIVGGWAR